MLKGQTHAGNPIHHPRTNIKNFSSTSGGNGTISIWVQLVLSFALFLETFCFTQFCVTFLECYIQWVPGLLTLLLGFSPLQFELAVMPAFAS